MSLISVYAGERRIVDYACIALAGAVLAAFFAVGLYGTAVGFVQTMAYFKANDVVSLVCGFIAAGCALYLVLELTSERRGRVVLAICVVCGTFGYFTVVKGVPAAVTNSVGQQGRVAFVVDHFESGGRSCSRNVVATNPGYENLVVCIRAFGKTQPRVGQTIEVYGRVSNWGITREDYRLR